MQLVSVGSIFTLWDFLKYVEGENSIKKRKALPKKINFDIT